MLVSSSMLVKQGLKTKYNKRLPKLVPQRHIINRVSKPKKIHLLYDNDYWCYADECNELKHRAPPDLSITCSNNYEALKSNNYDLVVQMCYGYVSRLKSFLSYNKITIPIITTYTVGEGYSDKVLDSIYNLHCKNIIINNLGMYKKFGEKPGTIYIPNGVNTKKFENRKKPRKNKVIFIGSDYHRKVKSYDDILVPLKDRLEKKNIECDFKVIDNTKKCNVIPKEELIDWYNESKVYVVASKSEGTPNPALEAASCGCTIVATRVGNMPELIKDGWNGYLCDTDIDDLEKKIILAVDNYNDLSYNMQKEIKNWDWSIMSKKFYKYFLGVISKKIL